MRNEVVKVLVLGRLVRRDRHASIPHARREALVHLPGRLHLLYLLPARKYVPDMRFAVNEHLDQGDQIAEAIIDQVDSSPGP